MARRPRFSPLGSVLLTCLLWGAGAAPASAAPRNDDFGDALPIRLGEMITGTTVGATMQTGEPQPSESTRHSVWYRFRAARTASVLLHTCGNTSNPVAGSQGISVYSGRLLRALRLVDRNVDGCPLGARVAFTARRDRTYRIGVTGVPDYSPGPFRLYARPIDTPPNDDFRNARWLKLGSSVVADTKNATLELGEPWYNSTASVWFKIRAATRTRVRLGVCSSNEGFPEELNVYTGPTVRRLMEVVLADCAVTFDARADAVYRIQVVGGVFDDTPRSRLYARAVTSAP